MDDERVALAVQKRSAIYDKNHPKHRNREVLKILWNECAAEINASEVEVVKKRWGYLRDYFTKQYRDKRAHARQPGQVVKRAKWPLYDTMSFLIPYIEQRENCQREHYDSNEHLSMQVEAVCEDQEFEELNFDDNSGPSRESEEGQQQPQSSTTAQEHSSIKFESIKRSSDSFPSSTKRLTSSSDPLTMGLRDISVNDDDDYFFKSIKPMLREMDPFKKLHFRTEVLKLLMNYLHSPSSGSTSPPFT